MRIGVVTVSRSVHTRVFVEYLVDAGHEVTVITNRDRFEVDGVRTINVRPFKGRRFKLSDRTLLGIRDRRIGRVLERERFDVVNVQMLMSDGVAATLLSPSPVVLTLYGSDVYHRDRLPDDYLRRLPEALQRAHTIHACSEHMAEELVRVGAPAEHIVTFQYGIDPQRFVPLAEADRAPRIISSRQLKPLYRVHLAVEAMPAVLDRFPDARLVIYDRGPEEPRLREAVARLGIGDAVEFPGFLPPESLAEDLGHSAVWVSIAESDGTPISLLEAMAAGAFPVVADIPTLHEWLSPDTAAFVGDPTPETLAHALIGALERARTGKHIEPNRRAVTERADRTANLARFERLLQNAAVGRSSWGLLV
ncbi:MAG: glycosyltransferase family 4 protein [Actinomycetota bacterium]|nr:glycosyltransferase family 4 protein [Actinomycetota bacterium]